ncbi:diguanylate cyclase [Paenibacillus sp. IB182496]|uniref:Diguanylate cyclase n=1 Tax=Paenibacillus sabuli TaxID=2772509 RepID=A0A927BSJ7_9BACL|nr:GGDEF domain-containing protein [Paenibacillus sabuli]MBD2844900.1 diguanylate cyclase [Paenibacillus sabuli]
MLLLFFVLSFVLITNTITSLHKVYLGLLTLLLVWVMARFGLHAAVDTGQGLYYGAAAYALLAMIGAGALLFAMQLAQRARRPRHQLYIGAPGVLIAAAALLNPGGLFLSGSGDAGAWTYGAGHWVLLAALAGSGVYGLYMLLAASEPANPRLRRQIRWALSGLACGVPLLLAGLALETLGSGGEEEAMTNAGLSLLVLGLTGAVHRHKEFSVVDIAQQDVIDSMDTGVLVLDEHDVVLEVNKAFRPYIDVRVGDPLDIEAFLASLRIQKGGGDFLAGYRAALPQRAQLEAEAGRDGSLSVVIYAAPIFDQYRTKIGRIVTLQDVSELRRLISVAEHTNQRLQERNRALIRMQDELFQANQKLEQMAITDSLTGCYNRRYLMRHLERDMLERTRLQVPFAVLLFDLDLFKAVNDRHGHLVGDDVICATAEAVRAVLRPTDLLARFGGEEFTVYLPNTNATQTHMLAERLRAAVAANRIPLGSGGETVTITISMGVLKVPEVCMPEGTEVKSYLRELFAQADAALYRAKNEGRNRIVYAQSRTL